MDKDTSEIAFFLISEVFTLILVGNIYNLENQWHDIVVAYILQWTVSA